MKARQIYQTVAKLSRAQSNLPDQSGS